MAGWKWVSGFLKRNPQISLRTPENTSLARAQAFNKPNIAAYFLALSAILAKYNFPPENMYNMDESGLSTVQKKSQKNYASKGRKQVGAVSSAERGKHVTIVCAMNAIGTFVPPAFIFPRERMKDELMNDAPVGSVCFAQEKGWMTTEIFLKWLKHFLRYTPKKTQFCYCHGSHKGLQAMEFAKENGIIIFCFPAPCSHHVQPLDVGFFRPLHTYYDQEIELWLRNNPGKAVTQFKVASIFHRAYLKSAVPLNAINSFTKTGIYPFNPDIFEDWQFAPSATTDTPFEDRNENHARQLENPSPEPTSRKSSPGPSTQTFSPPPAGLNISIKDICPHPSVSVVKGQRKGRKHGKTEYLNLTPEIEELKEKEAEKEEKKRKQHARQAKKQIFSLNNKFTTEDDEHEIPEAFEEGDSDDVPCSVALTRSRKITSKVLGTNGVLFFLQIKPDNSVNRVRFMPASCVQQVTELNVLSQTR
ncbi:hypothetical protein NQ318_018178 [Aromia moschata]|uniref:DDE-1 domain-containing protein n=1 Tax=Aromia moschata TaxID=1265417 RepID=A0AAV8ZCU6_9CUCU|nr:hypothetical protein NQ318_018178 [Aromia moschata]